MQPERETRRIKRWRIMAIASLMVLFFATSTGVVWATPATRSEATRHRAVQPDWMSEAVANQLALGFDVLVPAAIPAPLAGDPAISASDTSYTLYWMIPGTPPTFLQITGEIGGEIPDYSKYDRNNQLQINATVNGQPAYHDLTPIYDLVYWQSGDVVYSVESQNLTTENSMSIAEALVTLTSDTANQELDTPAAPDGGEPAILVAPEVDSGDQLTVSVAGPADAYLSVDAGWFPESGESIIYGIGGTSIDWQAPETDTDYTITFYLSDGTTGATLATAQTIVRVAEVVVVAPAVVCPDRVSAGEGANVTLTGSGYLALAASAGIFPYNTLNSAFDPNMAGDDSIGGEMPESHIVTVRWVAPSVNKSTNVVISVYDVNGNVPAGCEIAVTPIATADDPTSTPGAGAPPATLQAGDGTGIDDSELQVDEQGLVPTRTPESDGTNVEQGPARARPTAVPMPTKPAVSEANDLTDPTPSVEPSPTLAPATGDDGLVAAVIGPGGGSLASPAGASISIPAGALGEAATVTIRPVNDGKVFAPAGMELVPGTTFDITLAAASGRGISQLAKPARLVIALGDEQWREGCRIFTVDGSSFTALEGGSADRTAVSADVTHFSRFTVAVPGAQTGSGNPTMLFVILAVAAVLAMVVATTLAGLMRRRRPRTIGRRR